MTRKGAPAPERTGEEPPFEKRLERLETIVEELESGELSLEQTLARYEEGLKVSRGLRRTLEEAEKRIEQLTENVTGETRTAPMASEPGDDDEPRRPQSSRSRSDRESGGGGPEELPF